MARKSLNEQEIQEVIKKYDKGFGTSPANLSKEYGVHPTTIRRYLRQSGESSSEESHRVLLSERDKTLMRKVLVELRVKNPDKVISELDRRFEFKERQVEDEFITIHI